MYSVISSKTLTDEILLTVFAEVESFPNARQLTYVSSDPEDIESLTPNHFLLGLPELNAPLGIFDVTAPLTKQRQFARKLSSHLWNRLLKEFVLHCANAGNEQTNHVI